jgi:hypothetical protein
VNAPAQHEPHDSRQVTHADIRSHASCDSVREDEDDGASRRKHGAELDCVPFIGEVADDFGFEGVVWVQWLDEFGRGDRYFGHGGDRGRKGAFEAVEKVHSEIK